MQNKLMAAIRKFIFSCPKAAAVLLLSIFVSSCSGENTTTRDLLNGIFRDNPTVRIDVLDSNLIRIVYNQKMDRADISLAANYVILDENGTPLETISAVLLSGSEYTTIDLKTGVQTALENYLLYISNVKTYSGLGLKGSQIQAQFTGFNSEAVSLPSIQSVIVKSGTVLQIIFDQAMDSSGISEISNYSITDASNSISVVSITSLDVFENRILEIVTDFQTPGEAYTLTITGLKSAAGKVIYSPGISSSFSGYNSDVSPPEILAPATGTKITGLSATLVWSNRDQAETYTVEIVRDDGTADPFSNPINDIVSGNPITVDAPVTTLKFGPAEIWQLPEDYSYVWRVKADISTGWSPASSFHAFDDTMYVYCPAATGCSAYTDGIGNKSKPYRVIQEAITQAAAYNMQVFVAKRDIANSAYYESFIFKPGTRLYGGYDSTTWTKGTADRTRVESSNLYIVAINGILNKETVLDSFELISTSVIAENSVIFAQNNDGTLKIQNNILSGGSGEYSYVIYNNFSSADITGNIITGGIVSGSSAQTYGIYNNYSSPRIANNTIDGGRGIAGSYLAGGIYNIHSSPVIIDNIIKGGEAGEVTGIYNECSSPLIFRNTITSGFADTSVAYSIHNYKNQLSIPTKPFIAGNKIYGGTSIMYCASIYNWAGNTDFTNPDIINNIIIGGRSATTYGIRNLNAWSNIAGNIISSGIGTASYGISNAYTSHPKLESNIIITQGMGTRYGIYELPPPLPGLSDESEPDLVKNNAIFDTGSGVSFSVYYDYEIGCTANNDGDADNNTCNITDMEGLADIPNGAANNVSAAGMSDFFYYYPVDIVPAMDGTDSGTAYNGNSTTLELMDAAECSKFITGQFLEYFFDETVYTIGATDCAVNMTVTISPALSFDFGQSIPVLLWASDNTGYEAKYSLKTTSVSLNTGLLGSNGGGLGCPGGFEGTAQVHEWGVGTSQADCDSKFPFADSTYNGGKCQTIYLYPALEISGDSTGNDNGFCEQNETCLYNPNMGVYHGHGTLVNSGCNTSAILSGITMMIYDTNGY